MFLLEDFGKKKKKESAKMFIIFIRAPLISNISVLFLFKTIEDWLTIFS